MDRAKHARRREDVRRNSGRNAAHLAQGTRTLALACALVLAGCFGADPAPAALPTSTTSAAPVAATTAAATPTDAVEIVDRFGARIEARRVLPKATDPEIDSALEPHLVLTAPDVQKRGLLFIYLPGTRGRADESRHLAELAAARGMHAIGLRYSNYVAVQQLCATDPDRTCFERVRMEVIFGVDAHQGVGVDAASSILNRVDKLLLYLAARYADDGWGQFVSGGATIWEKVILTGVSQGGGMAAFIARDRLVGRVVMFASPVESFSAAGTRRAAPWTYQPHVTPSDRYYAFGHVRDPFGIEVMKEGWIALGLPGTPVDVDTAPPGFDGSHQLITARTDGSAPAHPMPARPVADTPGGTPFFLPAWEYLFGTMK